MKKLSYAFVWLMSLTLGGCHCEVWEHHECHDQPCDDDWEWDGDWDWNDDWDDSPGDGDPSGMEQDAGSTDDAATAAPTCEDDGDCDAELFCDLESGCCEPRPVCEAEADCEPGFNCDASLWLCMPTNAERCSELLDEASCVARDDCEPTYAGVRCSCGPECTCMGGEPDCVCEDFEFFRCGAATSPSETRDVPAAADIERS